MFSKAEILCIGIAMLDARHHFVRIDWNILSSLRQEDDVFVSYLKAGCVSPEIIQYRTEICDRITSFLKYIKKDCKI
jgi:hypothetical protein